MLVHLVLEETCVHEHQAKVSEDAGHGSCPSPQCCCSHRLRHISLLVLSITEPSSQTFTLDSKANLWPSEHCSAHESGWCVHVWRPEVETSVVFLNCSPLSLKRQSLSLNPAWPACPKDSCPCLQSTGVKGSTHPHPSAFRWVLGIRNMAPQQAMSHLSRPNTLKFLTKRFSR